MLVKLKVNRKLFNNEKSKFQAVGADLEIRTVEITQFSSAELGGLLSCACLRIANSSSVLQGDSSTNSATIRLLPNEFDL